MAMLYPLRMPRCKRLPQSHSKRLWTLPMPSSVSAPTRLGRCLKVPRESNAVLGRSHFGSSRLISQLITNRCRLIVIVIITHRFSSHIDHYLSPSRLATHHLVRLLSWALSISAAFRRGPQFPGYRFRAASRTTRWTCVPMAILACIALPQRLISRIILINILRVPYHTAKALSLVSQSSASLGESSLAAWRAH